jgi:hypothetical protein
MAMISKQRANGKPPVVEPKASPRKAATISGGKRGTRTSINVDTERHYIVSPANISVMSEKKEKAVTVEKKDDALPYISPDTKKLKVKLNHIYTAEPI